MRESISSWRKPQSPRHDASVLGRFCGGLHCKFRKAYRQKESMLLDSDSQIKPAFEIGGLLPSNVIIDLMRVSETGQSVVD